MVQAVSSHSSISIQKTSETAQTQATQAAEAKRQKRPEENKEAQQESTRVTLGQQGPSASVAPSRSPAQMYASVANIK
ncbi:MAG TPA: hypothetical protein VJ548_03345 [Azospira sp.]|nr:hypothetical protein [Azospira sp.]